MVGGRCREAVEVGREKVGVGAAGAPGGEAGGDAPPLLDMRDGVPEGLGVGAMGENASVGWLELVLDGLATARGHEATTGRPG